MDNRSIRLEAGQLSANIAPAVGGALAGFFAGKLPLLRPALRSGPYAGHPLGMACFPMVPFANRIDRGRFSHAGRAVLIARNVPERHPLHGHGWQSPWDVAAFDGRSTRLVFLDDRRWPWPYEASQEFTLEPDSLTITLTLHSLAAESFPASLGLHPYFPRAGGASLEARCTRLWARDDSGIPTEAQSIPLRHDFGTASQVAGTDLDHCFDEWSGQAVVHWPPERAGLRIEADDCRFLHVYSPGGEDYFCVEPMTARPDAFNPRADDRRPVPLVRPDESISLTMRLYPLLERRSRADDS